MMSRDGILLKRAYADPVGSDGYRMLIDRIWPREITKGKARIDKWANALATSTELRRWFDHNPTKWEEFRQRYFNELDDACEQLAQLAAKAQQEKLTLVFAAKSAEFNNAVALKEYLEHRLRVALNRSVNSSRDNGTNISGDLE